MFEYVEDLSTISSFIITLAMSGIGVAFFLGFSVKKLLHLIKSF